MVPAPQRLAGRYEVLGLLGSGGMGSVYRVRDVELDEVVALKVLRRELAETPGMLERFRQEVKLARRVTHRNVARTFDFGDHEGEKFLTMECVEGESLHSLIARTGPMPVQQAIGVGCALCDGLSAAHAAGVVHRDLKPENVLLDKNGRVVITDFGIARAFTTSATHTSGFILGSPAYMAPEQLTGDQDVDARADIYALGMILFELLTQRRAWPTSASVAAAMTRLRTPPPDPRTYRGDLPASLADVVLKCMATRRDDRYTTAGEAHNALLLARSRLSISPQASPSIFPHSSHPHSSHPHSSHPAAPAVSGSGTQLGLSPAATQLGIPPAVTQAVVPQGDQVPTQVGQQLNAPPPVSPRALAPRRGAATAVDEPLSVTLAAPPSRTLELKTVAVLPFRNAGPQDDEYLADGLTDDLTDTLSMIAGLRVRPRGAVARVRVENRDPRELGRELGVQVVVEGSIRRTGVHAAGGGAQEGPRSQPSGPLSQPGGVRVSVRVISVDEGFQLWAKRFDCTPDALLAVSDDAARAIAAALTVDLTARVRDPGGDPRAVELYLRARHQLRRLWYGDAGPAVALFEQALAHAPGDPNILSGYAIACARLMSARGRGLEQLAQAQQAAERAIAAAPGQGEPWVALATVHFCAGDPVATVTALRTALQRSPSLAKAHELLGRILMEAGAWEEAVFRLETALSLDPSELLPRWELARGRALLGDWTTASALLDLPVEDEASRFHRAVIRARFGLWRRRPFPVDDIDLSASTMPVRYARIFRDILATSNVTDEQRTYMRTTAEETERGSRLRPLFFQHYAEILGFMNEVDPVLEAIENAVDAGLFDVLWMRHCPLIEAARNDPRFAALNARVVERASAIVTAFKG